MSQKPCVCEGYTLDRLLQPTVMAMLAGEPCHGYALVEKLKSSPLMKGKSPDPTGVYRLLGLLEKQKLVSCTLSKSTEGPDRRQYQLTPSGKECLSNWINSLSQFQKNITLLVDMMRQSSSE